MTTLTGILLIVLPVAFNVAFAALAKAFDYPDILRRPTSEILDRFRAGGSRLVTLWWAFAMTALTFVPVAVLVSDVVDGNPTVLRLAAAVGVLAGLVQLLGLLRWPFLVPYLAREDVDASPARREAVDIVFQAFHRYLGVAVGEHLGYLLTGAWSVLVGVALTQGSTAPTWLGVLGIAVGALLMMCSLEFVGRFEPVGWRLAGTLVPVVYVAWSLWLAGVGVALLL
ncbi:DUF4386 domain-containing protein [Cellulomonas sp. P5_E12]